MPARSGPVYEVTLDIDRDIAGEFDEWLAGHVEEMLALPGIAEAHILTDDESGDERRTRRVCHYRFDDEQRLDEYLAGPAAALRQKGVERFGERYSAGRRILRPKSEIKTPAATCLNCGATLSGQYCGQCGQRARERLISLGELVRDAFGDLLELDSRLWRTLIPLATRPGLLTADYLRGRRARYMPPFRTYLVLSLLFFVFAFFDPEHQFGVLLEPQPAQPSAELAEPAQAEADADGLKCEITMDDAESMPPWLARRLTRERMDRICASMEGGDTGAIVDRLVENTPIGLYLLLPLIALVLKVLYPLSRRYYVEHLLFVIHFHAFIFLALTLQLFANDVGDMLPTAANVVLSLAIPLYIAVYLYKALRRVYGQGHLLTVPKYSLLLAAYFVISSVIFVATFLTVVLSL